LHHTDSADPLRSVEYGHARLGWSFTPLRGKRPYLKGWAERPRETLEQALTWARAGNVGLRMGRRGPDRVEVAIDVDTGADVATLGLVGTVTAYTGSGAGMHQLYWTEAEIGNSAGKLGAHIDVRGVGGQIVFPGSVHPDTGRRYEWAPKYAPWDVPIARLPEAIEAVLVAGPDRDENDQPPLVTGPTRLTRLQRYGAQAMQAEVAAVLAAPKGTRNNRLNTAAFSLGTLLPSGALDRASVEAELAHAAAAAGLPDKEAALTIRSGLESGIAQPRTVALRADRTPAPAKATSTPTPPAARTVDQYRLVPGPHVDADGTYHEQTNATFAQDALKAFPRDLIYRKDTLPGELLGEPGARVWQPLDAERVMLGADAHLRQAKWAKTRQGERVLVYQPCTRQNARLIIAAAASAPAVRQLNTLVAYPTFAPDFSLRQAGYNPADGHYYDAPAGLRDFKPVREYGQIHAALTELVQDFPFAAEADRENFYGLLLTPLVAPAIDGNRPLHLLNSPVERTGKTKLAEEILGGIITGRQTPAMQLTARDEERDKRIIGLLLSGHTLLHLDNLPAFIDSGALASVITATTYSGRMLGANTILNLANNMTIVASGNNVQATGELVKRAIPILLQPRTPDPEHRTDFTHPDLRAYVRSVRGHVLACLVGMVENWREAGAAQHAHPLGGFEAWSRVVGGILAHHGYNAWRQNEAEWRATSDPRAADLAEFVRLWAAQYGTEPQTASALRDLAYQHDLFAHIFARRNPHAQAIAFAAQLQAALNRPLEDWFVKRDPRANRSLYRLEPAQLVEEPRHESAITVHARD